MALKIKGNTVLDIAASNNDIYLYDGTGTILRQVISASGYVGIGTSSPAYTLDVIGDARITGNLTLGDASTDNVTINAVNFNLANNVNFDAGLLYLDVTNNQVGISTSSPSSNLQVNGTFAVTGPLSNNTPVFLPSTGANTYPLASLISSSNLYDFQGTSKNAYGVFISPYAVANSSGFHSVAGVYSNPRFYSKQSGSASFSLYGTASSATRDNPLDAGTQGSCFIFGQYNSVGHSSTANSKITTSYVYGEYNNISVATGSVLTHSAGTYSSLNLGTTANLSPTMVTYYGLYTNGTVGNSTAGSNTVSTLTNYYDAYLAGVSNVANSTVTSRYGLYQAAGNHLNYFAGSVGIGISSPAAPLHIENDINSQINLVRNTSDAAPTYFAFTKRRGTAASKTTVNNNDTIFSLQAYGYDGTGDRQSSSINAVVDAVPTSGNVAGRLVFSTTAAGGSTPTERMRIDSSGSVGIGTSSITGTNLIVGKNLTGGSSNSSYGIVSNAVVQADSNTISYGISSALSTQATSYTQQYLTMFYAGQGTIGAGSSVTNQHGFFAAATLVGATNNYGFYSNIPAGTGRWNFYAAGTADNYFAGNVGFGSTNLGGASGHVRIALALTGSTGSNSILATPTVQSDVTTAANIFATQPLTQAASFTLATLNHYSAGQGIIGSGSSVTNQIGFRVSTTLTGATNNYGFYGDIAAGAGRWNFYAAGTAANYFNGTTIHGSSATSISSSSAVSGVLQVSGTSSSTSALSVGNYSATTNCGSLYFSKSRSATVGLSDVAVASGDATMFLAADGSDGTSQIRNAYIGAYVDGTPTTGSVPGRIVFATTPSGSGTASERMRIDSNGGVSIGVIGNAQIALSVGRNITGNTSSYGIFLTGSTQSDVTGNAYYFATLGRTAAASFTCNNLYHYYAKQDPLGAGSSVTNQYGNFVDSTLTGATNNYGFYGNIASGTGRWNLYMNGTADNYLAGSLGIGATSLTGYGIHVSKAITGATTAVGIQSDGVIQSDVTTSGRYITTYATTAATSFNLPDLRHYTADQGTFGAGSTVTSQYGFFATSGLTGANNNYGFYGNIPAGTNNWNFYAAGTAPNQMAGALGIGSTSLTARDLRINRALTGSTSAYSIYTTSSIQSDVTSSAYGITSGIGTAAASFNVSQLAQFAATQGTIGAGSTVTSQYGFFADASIVGANNNYGFYGNIPAGSNRWNFYAVGTADNYFAGNVGIGSTLTSSGYKLYVEGVSAILTSSDAGTNFNIQNRGNASASRWPALNIINYSGNTTNQSDYAGFPVVELRRSRGNTTNPGIVQSGDILGGFNTWGGNNLTTLSATRIQGVAEGTFTTAATAGLQFHTTYAGNQSERMRIDANGNVGINTSAPAYKLDVNGDARITGNLILGDASSDTVTINAANFNLANNVNFDSGLLYIDATNNRVGVNTTTPAYTLQVAGSFAAQTKSFVIMHPTKPDMKLRYGSLEGPENGVYVRGKVNNYVIDLPDYWTGLVDEDTISVQLTPYGRRQMPYVVKVENNKVHILNSDDTMPSCYYTVYAERKDVDKLEVEFV